MIRQLKLYVLLLFVPVCLTGQSLQNSNDSQKVLLLRIKKLEEQLSVLMQQMENTKKQDEMQRLLDKAKQLSEQKKVVQAEANKKFTSGLRQQSALNPNISLGGDSYFAWGTSKSEYNRSVSDFSWGTGQVFLREMELALQASLDPFSRAKVYFSFSRESVIIEEGYMEWLNLPLNLNLKLGEYKAQFGKLNRYHDHALPQFARPLVFTNLFGTQSLKGFGAAANILLPSIIAHVNELDLELLSGGNPPVFTGEGNHNFVFVGHFKNYYDLNRSTYFELGLSAATGFSDEAESKRTSLGAADLTLKWSPPSRSKYREIEWRSEIVFSRAADQANVFNSWGFYSYIQMKMNERWTANVRIDFSQLPMNSGFEEKGFAVSFLYWQSEFVHIRFQFTHINRNFDESDNRLIVQTSWAMGPHKHEAY
ncbi:hypothetical protein BVY01_01270 [bacterium I07]|nr:hypothetical protein BVY01_01270 [bacterium I07]